MLLCQKFDLLMAVILALKSICMSLHRCICPIPKAEMIMPSLGAVLMSKEEYYIMFLTQDCDALVSERFTDQALCTHT